MTDVLDGMVVEEELEFYSLDLVQCLDWDCLKWMSFVTWVKNEKVWNLEQDIFFFYYHPEIDVEFFANQLEEFLLEQRTRQNDDYDMNLH